METVLLGQKMVIRSDENPEIVRQTIQIVEAKIALANQRSRPNSPLQAALLALLDLASDYVKTKEKVVGSGKELFQKVQELRILVETELP